MGKISTVSIYEAKTQLSRLIDRASRGDEVVITRHGRPVARLVGAAPRRSPRRLGQLRGKIRVAADFDAPLPDSVLDAFEGSAK
jgi:prevent-host-death family protein